MAAHWDLMGELGSMQDRIHRMWGQLHDRTVDGVGLWMPAVDIYETDEKAIVVKADLPGLDVAVVHAADYRRCVAGEGGLS